MTVIARIAGINGLSIRSGKNAIRLYPHFIVSFRIKRHDRFRWNDNFSQLVKMQIL